MNSSTDAITGYGYALAALAYGAFCLPLLATGHRLGGAGRSMRLFTGAVGASAVWAGVAMLAVYWDGIALQLLAPLLDLLRYGLWFAFLLTLFGTGPGPLQARPLRWIRYGAGFALLLSLLLLVLRLTAQRGGLGALDKDLFAKAAVGSTLALPLIGLLLVEQLVRNLADEGRWHIKPVFLGLACVFVFDVWLYAEALLFGQFDPVALSVRGLAHALAVPFLFVAARREPDWSVRLQVSRSAAFHSVTLVLAGAYLLFMSAIGYYVRYFGGEWGPALQLGLLIAGMAFLFTLAFSGSLRSRLRVFVGKHFFRYRYDYREEWLRFTAMLSSNRSPQETGEAIVRGLAKLVECPSGSLWTRTEAGYVQNGHWNMPPVTAIEPVDSSLCRFLRSNGWVIDLNEFRESPRRYVDLALPTWLLGLQSGWLVVPLLAGDALSGFVLLGEPRTPIQLNWEVLDLLKTAGKQAAGYLAQMQATEALLEARKFEAFNRMSAFVVHDLKNIVAQLSLMLKNAERLHDNQEFQQDMLLTVESSLEKMKRLMLQLREGATPPGGSRGVELSPIAQRLAALVAAQGRQLELRSLVQLSTRGHADRLERVLGHLVQNALDATPADGTVWLSVVQASGQVRVEVGDSGAGMSEEFVRTRLFRPFNTTKQTGMGIGSHESSQYIRELGGSIAVDSELGRGTVITVLLPLFEAGRASDLLSLADA